MNGRESDVDPSLFVISTGPYSDQATSDQSLIAKGSEKSSSIMISIS